MEVPTFDIAIIVLLLIISAVGIATRRTRFPYPIALVITGLLLGELIRQPLPFVQDLRLDQIQLTPHLILVVFLPALLFEATLHIEARRLRRWLLPIGLLAVPGVVITAGIVGALMTWSVRLDWPTALLFGAIVAATDPIAVLAIFKRLSASRDLELLVEGESLFNDGTAVVLSRILIAAVAAGHLDIGGGVYDFVLVVGGGVVVGTLTGLLASRITATIDDHLIEITLTTILAYGTFVAAEVLHVSGVIAVVAAGLVMGNVGAQRGMSPTTRLALLNFWEYIAFLLNSAIFLVIGLQVNLRELAADIVPVGVAIGAVLLARAVTVYGLGVVVLPLPPALPRPWLHTLFWAGLRGALSLAVVLGLPADLPARPLLLHLTFGVVLFTLLVQGLTMEPLLRRLRLVGTDQQHVAYLARRAKLLMQRSALRELRRLKNDAVLSRRVFNQLETAYQAAGEELAGQLESLYHDQAALEAEELRSTREHLLYVERSTLRTLLRQGMVDAGTAQDLAEVVDARLLALQSGDDSSALQTPGVDELAPDAAAHPPDAFTEAAEKPRTPRESEAGTQ